VDHLDLIDLNVLAAGRPIEKIQLDHDVDRIQPDLTHPYDLGSGAFHAKHRPVTELRIPVNQLLITLATGGEGQLTELAAIGHQDDGHVKIKLGIDGHDVDDRKAFRFVQSY